VPDAAVLMVENSCIAEELEGNVCLYPVPVHMTHQLY